MTVGSTALTWYATTLASGLSPYRLTASSLTTTLAAAPSQIPLAFPAVTAPFLAKTGGSLASDSTVACGRGCSSCLNEIGSPPRFLGGREIGAISASNAPASSAVRQRQGPLSAGRAGSQNDGAEQCSGIRRTGLPSLLTLHRILVTLLPGNAVLVREVLGRAVAGPVSFCRQSWRKSLPFPLRKRI